MAKNEFLKMHIIVLGIIFLDLKLCETVILIGVRHFFNMLGLIIHLAIHHIRNHYNSKCIFL